MEVIIMLSSTRGNRRRYTLRLASIFVAAAALLLAALCDSGFAAAKRTGQELFQSPEEAANAFFHAVKSKDSKRLLAILGPAGKDLIHSGDSVADREAGDQVVRMFEENNKIIKVGDRKAVIEMGSQNWPFPIPVIEEKGKWRFDTISGRNEILNRRIGKNELSAIEVCRAYVDAQREYAAQLHEGGGSAYAQKFFSAPGKRDGLYWETKQGEPQSPVGIFLANAMHQGYKKSAKPTPYHGYFFRILKAQGKNAPGGAYDYVVKGKMIGGFSLLAYPAKYGSSGVMSFMVNHEGVVYEKNLGPATPSVARGMKRFDPDKSWRQVE